MARIFPFLFLMLSLSSSCKKGDNNAGGPPLVITTDTNHLVLLTESDYRPVYHFTPARNWMNDPNGLVYYKGVFHLFYQYNPNANVWGPMNWGHATSTNLFNWQDYPIALTPDNLGTIFSGSAVVDVNNTTGFKTGSEDPIVAVFTHNGAQQMQSLAYSNDGGSSWNKFPSNPVIQNPGLVNFRDPKAFWYAGNNKWGLVLAAGDRVQFYSSADLKGWTLEGEFGVGLGAHGGVWECPDLFELPVTGTNEKKWVLLVSLNGGPNGGTATQYFVGDFDGKSFTPASTDINWVDYGPDNYAGATYNNIPSTDGRRIFLGWMSNWAYAQNVPTSTWRSTMTMPRSLSLSPNGNGYLLHSSPLTELSGYETGTPDTSFVGPVKGVQVTDNQIIKSGSYEIGFSVDLTASSTFVLNLGNPTEKLILAYNKATSNLTLDRSGSGKVDFNSMLKQIINCPFVPLNGKPTNFRIFVDKTSIEVFVNQGERVMTTLFFPNYQYNLLNLQGDGSSAPISNFYLRGVNKSMLR